MVNSATGHGMTCMSSGVKDLTSRCHTTVGVFFPVYTLLDMKIGLLNLPPPSDHYDRVKLIHSKNDISLTKATHAT